MTGGNEADRDSVRDMIREIYAILSGPPGPRPYQTVKRHYDPRATLVRTGVDDAGRAFATVMSVDEHHADVDQKLADIAFLEEEIAHECEIFGNIARVRSVYRSVYGSESAAIENRGVNFFNLVKRDGVWKIMSIVWDNERPGLKLDDPR